MVGILLGVGSVTAAISFSAAVSSLISTASCGSSSSSSLAASSTSGSSTICPKKVNYRNNRSYISLLLEKECYSEI